MGGCGKTGAHGKRYTLLELMMWDAHDPAVSRMITAEYQKLDRADPEAQRIHQFMTSVMTAGRAIFTQQSKLYRVGIPDDPNTPGKWCGFLKFLEAHSVAALKDRSPTAKPAIRERWHMAKITLYANWDPMVFVLARRPSCALSKTSRPPSLSTSITRA